MDCRLSKSAIMLLSSPYQGRLSLIIGVSQAFVALLIVIFLEGDLVLRMACFKFSIFSRYIRDTARKAMSVLVGTSWPSSAASFRSISAASTLDDSSFFFSNSLGWGRMHILC